MNVTLEIAALDRISMSRQEVGNIEELCQVVDGVLGLREAGVVLDLSDRGHIL